MEQRNVLISGASIAGPALAFWLNRYGFRTTIVEQSSAPRGGGQAIDLRGAARDVAERMGFMPQIRRRHTGAKGMSFIDGSGRRVASMGADLLGDSGGVIADIEILRGDLVDILYRATKNDVEYLFADSITSMTHHPECVDVTFEHAGPRRFDLVVGADGLHSNVRRLVFGEESRFVHDLGCYTSIFGAPNDLGLHGWELMYSVPGKTVAVYPVRENTELKAMFIFASPTLDYDRHDVRRQKTILTETFAGAGWEVPRLLQALWQSPDFYFDRVCQVRLDRWWDDRVALVGDAAYCPSPMAGVGTSLALVGAYVLAGELATAGDDLRRAFERYQAEMADFVRQAQALANGARFSLTPKTRTHIWFRNQMIRTLPHMPWKKMVTGGVEKAANAVTLKDYAARQAIPIA
jgi:2-polyprenyl-6-methoxyphenol hydroxylase-like FAD-dependent oxidoreductase